MTIPPQRQYASSTRARFAQNFLFFLAAPMQSAGCNPMDRVRPSWDTLPALFSSNNRVRWCMRPAQEGTAARPFVRDPPPPRPPRGGGGGPAIVRQPWFSRTFHDGLGAAKFVFLSTSVIKSHSSPCSVIADTGPHNSSSTSSRMQWGGTEDFGAPAWGGCVPADVDALVKGEVDVPDEERATPTAPSEAAVVLVSPSSRQEDREIGPPSRRDRPELFFLPMALLLMLPAPPRLVPPLPTNGSRSKKSKRSRRRRRKPMASQTHRCQCSEGSMLWRSRS